MSRHKHDHKVAAKMYKPTQPTAEAFKEVVI
jgi:hypothetical protein